MKKTFEITFTRDTESGIYSANLILAESAEQATAYFATLGKYEIVGCTETANRPKPGQPVHEVPEGWTAPEKEEEKTMQEFTIIKQEVAEDSRQTAENRAFYIANGYMKSWAEEHRQQSDNGLKEYSTARRWEQYQAGEITREKAVEYATKRALTALEKETARKLAHIDRIAAAPDCTFISVSVDWVRSRVWGYNPRVEVRTNTGYFKGFASGCGYDKESAAIAEAFNQCDSILKALYTLKEKGLQAGQSDRSKTASCGRSNGDICGYGAGYGARPYFEGGVGASCFWEILKKCGFSVSCHYSKHSNFYSAEREVV